MGFDLSSNIERQLEVLHSLPVIFYICDMETKEILFLSKQAQEVLGAQQGETCYQAIYGNSDACDFCSNPDLFDDLGNPVGTVISEFYNPKLNRWFECRTQAMRWGDGRMVRLETAIDITDRVHLQDNLSPQDEYFLTVLRSIGDGVMITDQDGKVTWMNAKAQELTGWSKHQAKGLPLAQVFRIINTKTRQPCADPVSKVLQTGEVVGLANHTSLLAKNGREYQIADSAAPIRDDQGIVHGVILVFHDVTEDYRRQEELRKSEERFRGLFQHSINAIALHEIICNEEGKPVDYRFLALNSAFEEMTGLKVEKLIGKTVLEVLPGTERSWINNYGRVALTGATLDFEDYSQDLGKHYSVRAYSPRAGQFVTVFYDISQRKKMEEKLNELVFQDSLTGLYNRRYFEQEMERLSHEESHLPLSVIMGDVNGLKIINDSMGHHQGDLVLQSVANILQKACRPQDIVARWGGDEFVILMPNATPEQAQEVCLSIEEVIAQAEQSGPVPSLALGCATKNLLEEPIHEVLREAENRMYQHKMNNVESSRSTLVASLQRALAEKSHETEEHARHLQTLALALGEYIGLSDAQLDKLSLVALLHDVGKVAIPESILDKPGPLTDDEWEIMKQHCESGYRIVVTSPDLIEVAEAVLSHHENWDGSGYPRGLRGTEIPLSARIISLVDAYDAMTTDWPYRTRVTPQEALAEIRACSNSQFDPELAEEFITLMEKRLL